MNKHSKKVKIIQIAGDFKQLWALSSSGDIYMKEWKDVNSSVGWGSWVKVESPIKNN